MTVEIGLSASEDAWELPELPPNLAVLTCKHVLDGGAQPGFVDYRGGHLTVLCDETAHEEDTTPDAYGMVHPAHLLAAHEGLVQVRLVGGYSNACRSEDGTWTMKVIPKPGLSARVSHLFEGLRSILPGRS